MTDPMRLKARAEAPLPAVRAALTDPTALRTWLAEHAEVALPRTFEFWGRYTPEGDAPHQRLLHADDHTLRFSWLIGGEDTTVEITLAEEGAGATIVTLTQSHFPDWPEVMAGTNPRGVLHTFWALAIANLVDHVEGRDLTPKCDFTSTDLRAELFIGASPKEVYESLIDPVAFSRWFGAKVDIEPHVGGRFAMGGFDLEDNPAKILDLDPCRRVQLAWDGGDGVVDTWELADSGGGTRLTFVQSGFDKPDYGGWAGWLGGVAELRRYHELDSWRPLWLSVEVVGLPEAFTTVPHRRGT
ncbi:MAG: SRPBCC family protein [Umezawaea sp.]